jgi:putative CocE/NonD family hydrolase
LHVETDRTNTDFTVKLVDVFDDGTAYNITDGIIRQNYIPGTPTEITVELSATSYLFKKGHRIRVDVSSSNFPRFDRNPNTGQDPAHEINPIIAHQKLLFSPGDSSQIILPVIPR